MVRRLILAVVLVLWLPAAALANVTVTADYAVLIDGRTGQVLYEKKAHERRPPASTTKIMTAILALEHNDPEEKVMVSHRASLVGEASIDLEKGESFRLIDLVKGALIESGNDASVAIAEHVGGSEAAFLQLMNKKARLVGARDTHFVNTNGLPAEDHWSTAYDLAMMARYALRNPVFARIVATKETTIPRNGGWGYRLVNTNRLLWSYQWADGVKTGTTDNAGACLVASATKQGRQLISVVLHSDDRFGDSINLLEYGFLNFSPLIAARPGEVWKRVPVTDGEPAYVDATPANMLEVVVPRWAKRRVRVEFALPESPRAPVQLGQKLGELVVTIDGQELGRTDLVAVSSSQRQPAWRIWWHRLWD